MSVDGSVRAWMLPDERVAVRLMNTIWVGAEGIRDDLRAPGDLDAWFDAAGLGRAGARATAAELAAARGLRDAARGLAAFVTADPGQAAGAAAGALDEALATVNAVAADAAAPALTLAGGRLVRTTQTSVSPVTAGLARVAADAIDLLGGDDAARLRACPAQPCVLYFVKTHPRREWCSVACGNRVRAARHYQRTRGLRSS